MYRIPTFKEIKTLRLQSGLTQSELAKIANVSQSLIARLESGSVDPRISTVRKLLFAIEKGEKKERIQDIIDWKILNGKINRVISVKPDDNIKKATSLMKQNDISQLPVVDKGKILGSIQETTVVKLFLSQSNLESVFQMEVRNLMEESFPILNSTSEIEELSYLISRGHPAVLIVENGNLVNIITKIDLISFSKEKSK
ncbi:MAG: CBS domain-containing protein [Candidatus Ranarchaeia archaeon]